MTDTDKKLREAVEIFLNAVDEGHYISAEMIEALRTALADSGISDAQEVKRCEHRNASDLQCLLDAGHGSRGDTQPHICDTPKAIHVSELNATADAPPKPTEEMVEALRLLIEHGCSCASCYNRAALAAAPKGG